MVVVVGGDIVGAGFDGALHDFVLADGVGGDADFAFAVELVGDAAWGGDAAAAFGEDRAEVGGGAVEVVRGHFDEEGDAGGAVSFVGDFLDGIAAEFAGAFAYGAFDVVLGHGHGLGVVNGGAQAGVGGRISATGAGGKGNLMGTPTEHAAFDGVHAGFDVFDLGPLVVTSHDAIRVGKKVRLGT